jgi:hypothetical protein
VIRPDPLDFCSRRRNPTLDDLFYLEFSLLAVEQIAGSATVGVGRPTRFFRTTDMFRRLPHNRLFHRWYGRFPGRVINVGIGDNRMHMCRREMPRYQHTTAIPRMRALQIMPDSVTAFQFKF